MDIGVNLHVGFIAQHDYKKKIVMDGKKVLWYYLEKGGAWIDVLSITPLCYEVTLGSRLINQPIVAIRLGLYSRRRAIGGNHRSPHVPPPPHLPNSEGKLTIDMLALKALIRGSGVSPLQATR